LNDLASKAAYISDVKMIHFFRIFGAFILIFETFILSFHILNQKVKRHFLLEARLVVARNAHLDIIFSNTLLTKDMSTIEQGWFA
jgi:hypothetical protein